MLFGGNATVESSNSFNRLGVSQVPGGISTSSTKPGINGGGSHKNALPEVPRRSLALTRDSYKAT